MPPKIVASVRLCGALAAALTALALSGCVLDFSPDGKQLVYPWLTGLAISTVDGQATHPVEGGAMSITAKWSPNGRYVLFVTEADGKSEVKLYDTATRKTKPIGGNLTGPVAWREDSGWLACVHELDDGKYELWQYSVAEGGMSAHYPVPFRPDGPMVWLPGTNDVAVLASSGDIYTVEAGEAHRVTTSRDVIGMALAPGGKKLVWARKGPNLRYILLSLWAWDLKARNVVRLPFSERVPGLNPDPRHAPESVDWVEFAPDGRHLALLASFDQPATKASPAGGYMALFVVTMDGRQSRLVQKGGRITVVHRTPSMLSVPHGRGAVNLRADVLGAAWSHDGKQLGVLYSHGDAAKLFVTDADGSNPRRIRMEGDL